MLYRLLLCNFSFAFARIFTFLIAFLPPRGHTFFVCFQIVDVFLLAITSRGGVLQCLRADILDIIAWAMLAVVWHTIFINPVIDFSCSQIRTCNNDQ